MSRTTKYSRIFSALIILTLFTFLVPSLPAAERPKNIILLIGDGMGVGPIMAARIAGGGPGHKLAMDSMPEACLTTTYSANSLVTDSAAAATALASGVKTNNGMLGVTPDGKKLRSILDAAETLGKSTGLVTTVTITHATPAGFVANIDKRSEEPAIAEQMAESGVEVLLGGGLANFIPRETEGSNRKDSRNLLEEMKGRGYAVVDSGDALMKTDSPKIVGLFWPGYMSSEQREPSVADMAGKAIETLSRDRDGFFLMVEGGQIDSKGHGNDVEGMIRELTEFDQAVARALEFAKKDGKTLVVVTADHDTGGLAVKDDGNKLKGMWIDGGHTGNPVQLYAFGPGASGFEGLLDNTDVPKKMAELWRVKIGIQD